MISAEQLEKLSKKYHTTLFPNTLREYFQHIFLSELYKIPEAEKLLFKGGTALRIIYGSPRFSEDLDFSIFQTPKHQIKHLVEELFVKVLAEIERMGITTEIGKKSGATTGGYFGVATLTALDYPRVEIEINVSSRNGKDAKGEVDSVVNDFTPSYNITHLPQEEIVDEKIFGALKNRKKPRDFYDLYFLMRKNMISPEQKKKLSKMKDDITTWAKKIDFQAELGTFLPTDQQSIIRNFAHTLEAELNRQLA
ncbi:MAG TPA: nucleotidyl transferase AbiEii/AbiGii toxin family protein [Negativicutes bacterium]|nr:nucleotidyl transferase AbiEii/AbiGii toxin family protein [Negativicutes bacterium]